MTQPKAINPERSSGLGLIDTGKAFFCVALFVFIALFLYCLKARPAHAQTSQRPDPCDAPTQAVSTLYEDPENTAPEILTSIARTARRARLCYGNTKIQRVIWLLNKEVWSLIKLREHNKAEPLVDLFYEKYFAASTDEYRAHFALHKLLLLSVRGDFISAAMSYEQAQRYRTALPLERQIHMLLDGAYVHSQSDSYDIVLQIAEQAGTLAQSEPDAAISPIVHARILAVKAEAILRLEKKKTTPNALVHSGVLKDLKRARDVFHAHKTWTRYLTATITLGQVYAVLGNTAQAHAHFEQARAEAQEYGKTPGRSRPQHLGCWQPCTRTSETT